jgi:signal transduction histidine kinase
MTRSSTRFAAMADRRTGMSDAATGPDQGDILIVDDMPANLRLLSQMLAGRGYKVRAVLNGARALAAAQVAPPDLILLDIMMPEMDGYEVCQRLKMNERTRDIPVVFISALGETEDKVKGLMVGGVDYIAKPFQLEEVLARVRTHLALRNLQESLRQEIAERDRLIAELDAFAHTVAHDLKNPLGLVLGYAESLIDDGEALPPETVKDSLQAIVRTTLRMNNIIEELMLLSGVRKTHVEMQPLDMAGILPEVLRRLAPLIREHKAEISLPDAWPQALSYGPWVEEVWANFLSNAVKYGGRPPRVELGADLLPNPPVSAGEAGGGGMVRFWVRDNGDGISPQDQARLFAPFERLSQVRIQGHGLGLSIVRRIVEKLGGQVGVESEGVPGKGSTFFFTLPGV